jgi:acetyltransferase-like isoleucine patch superfamily enzyme
MLARITSPVPPGLWLVNILAQRMLRINSTMPFMVHFTSVASGKIKIGKNVGRSFALSGNCYIQGINGIEIGDDTIFAPGVKMISANHDTSNLSTWVSASPIRIGKRCWIGANAVVLPGVELGNDVVIGAGAVVTKSIPNGSVAVGNPAKVISENK